MPVRFREKNNMPQLMKQLDVLKKRKIKVGIFGDSDMSMIAAVHEFGARIKVTPAMRGYLASIGYPLKASTMEIVIPERSFIRAGFDANEKAFMAHAKKMLADAFEANISADTMLDMLGQQLAGKLQDFITDIREPSLSDMTVEMTGRHNPLVHGGQLRGAISHRVE